MRGREEKQGTSGDVKFALNIPAYMPFENVVLSVYVVADSPFTLCTRTPPVIVIPVTVSETGESLCSVFVGKKFFFEGGLVVCRGAFTYIRTRDSSGDGRMKNFVGAKLSSPSHVVRL